MKIERFECDKCGQASNGDLSGWFGLSLGDKTVVEVYRLRATNLNADRHACGEACAVSMISEMMRALPK